ncbi:flagellar biosynthesis protein FlhA [Mahella australiensis]|uniref:Flagellar biosynthesis protein FlhA n=1 Tax=Mahella australiensis (strain DSM 15567 / CIP 107919 / 50-1 BON) TaxID=697281 RepID=F4A1V6_MAHA5|nr:flagellar biosynthesis protein FlhA [Mahella australiensis]AEE96072.1 flagellar biosynthesis protein FlhA [Mahella australiensis 50-1 BON]
MKLGDIAIAFVAVAVTLLIIIPLPSGLLDVLLSFNIALALIILLISLYVKEPLEFSIFPSLLLLATIFRIALNISSTRLILSEGYAGQVIEAFGNFVIGNDIIVGVIIFLIIFVVQFIVVTRGAERVAEVAARFTLDAMPGKQMAIDADLNSGIISEAQARERRAKIQREADFYGAMDGASKFVKGDAIVSIIIAVINIIGGIITGMLVQGMDFAEVLNRYTLLTVGDGLVSQVPALLISVGTGIIVTRAASESNMSRDLVSQITSQPVAMLIAGITLIVLAFMGLPKLPMFSIGGVFIYLGYTIQNTAKLKQQQEETSAEKTRTDEIRRPENVLPLLQVDPIELEFGYNLIPLADVNQGGDLLDRVVMIRRQLALDLGIVVPMIRIRDNIQLKPNQYVIKIKGVEVAEGELMPDRYMAMNPGAVEHEINGIPGVEPAFGLPAIWITAEQKDEAEMAGYTVVDPPSVMATHLTEVIRRHSYELLGRQEVQGLIDNIKQTHPVLVDELIPKLMTVGEVQKVLQNLLKENVPIRDMVTILETLADYVNLTRDPDMLTEYVRHALSRTITRRFIQGNKASAITVDPSLEQLIMDSVKQTEQGTMIAMEPSKLRAMLSSLSNEIRKLSGTGIQPIVITSPVVRIYFKRLTEQLLPDLPVLSYNELEPSIEVQSVGMVRI